MRALSIMSRIVGRTKRTCSLGGRLDVTLNGLNSARCNQPIPAASEAYFARQDDASVFHVGILPAMLSGHRLAGFRTLWGKIREK